MNPQKYRTKCLNQKINACNVCGCSDELQVHHVDGDRTNNQLSNLIPVCTECHKKIHYGVKKEKLNHRIEQLRSKLPTNKQSRIYDGTGMDVTTVQCSKETRDRLSEYKDEHGFENYNQTLQHLLQGELQA